MDENQEFLSQLNNAIENIRSQTQEATEMLSELSLEAVRNGDMRYSGYSDALVALLKEAGLTNKLLYEIVQTQINSFAKLIEQHQQLLQRLQRNNDDEIHY